MPYKKSKKSRIKDLSSLDSSDDPSSSVDDTSEVSSTSVDSSKLEKRRDELSPKSKIARRAKLCKSDYSPIVSREDEIWQKSESNLKVTLAMSESTSISKTGSMESRGKRHTLVQMLALSRSQPEMNNIHGKGEKNDIDKATKTNKKKLQKQKSDYPSLTVFLVNADNESSFEPKCFKEIVQGLLPISYEDEIVQKRTQILRDPLQDLLLFPTDDISAYTIPRELRTEHSTVPKDALSRSTNLFTRECIRSYTSSWNCIENKYAQYSGSYLKLPRPSQTDGLQEQIFEADLTDQVDSSESNYAMSPLREKGITKQGYLTKAPFHGENDKVNSITAKTYKRRWFNLKQTSNDGSYVLEYRKDDHATTARGVIYLDSCTHISKGVKGKMYGFELHIHDKTYSLVADSQSDMDQWIASLCRVTGIDIDSCSKSTGISFSVKTRLPTKQNQSLRESLKNSKHPILLEYSKETDVQNAKRRRENRYKLFSLVRDLDSSACVSFDDARVDATVYKENFGTRFIVSFQDLKFRLTNVFSNGEETNVEPFFIKLAIFDAKKGIKLSEDFCCDLNDPRVADMLKGGDLIENGETNGDAINEEKRSKNVKKEIQYDHPTNAIFSVTCPHAEVYLVVRIEKVLQGSIGSCVEPYIKSGDIKKTAVKVLRLAEICCKKLGQYTMPFGWAARQIFNNEGTLDENAEFTPIYKQDREKLTDEDMVKLLSNVSSNDKLKQQIIPATLQIEVGRVSDSTKNVLTPSLMCVKPFHYSIKEPPTIEIEEFNQSIPEAAYPHTTYVNNFYIYPLTLNFNSQKVFSKARNIAVTIEFRDIDAQDALPLKCIYNTNGTPTLTTRVTAAVIHHCTNPTFYQEVKIKLPTQITEKHHIFFTFQHIACEQSKSMGGAGSVRGKPSPVETPVGYAWMPILHNKRVREGEISLMVSQSSPDEYLSAQYVGLSKVTGPDVKWVDKEKPLFKVNTRLVSTVYTQDEYVDGFFAHCQKFHGSPSSEIEKSKTLKLLNAVDVNTVIRFLPVIFNQLFHVMLVSHSEDVTLNVARVLIRITSQVHEAKRIEALKSYVKYVFVTERVENSSKTVHEELAKTLTMNLKPGSDPAVVSDLMKHSWFFFEIIAKSMAQTLVESDKAKRMNRDNWFPESLHRSLENFVQAFVPQIIKRLKELAQIAKDANFHLACFTKDCFTYMDRGFVFQMITYYSEQFRDSDTQMREFKFEFLQVVCNHEHYIPLNLPLDIRGLGGIHDCELSDEYCKRFFLVGLLLREVSSALTQGRHIRKLAIRVLRNLLVKHELDPRYDHEGRQSRIAALYLPFLTILLDHVPRFQGSNYELPHSLSQFSQESSYPVLTSDPPSESNRSSAYSGNLRVSPSDSLTPVAPNTPKEASQMALKVPFDDEETKELLLCFMYILKNLEQGVILDWWRQIMTSAVKRAHWHPTVLFMLHQDKYYSKFAAVIDMFDLLKLCLKHFRYQGKSNIQANMELEYLKATWRPNLPANNSSTETTKQYFEQRYKNYSGSSSKHSRNPSQGGNNMDLKTRVLMEGNLSNEVGLVVLDLVELFCNHFKFHLEQDDGDNLLMKKVFDTLVSFLQISQSELMIKHVFASLRSFINKFPIALFRGSANHCGDLCREILGCCNSKLESLRTQACAYLYLMMRSNYEFTGGMNCDRIHWQVIVAVSRLMQSGLNRPAVNNSLIALKNYANDDKGMKNTSFPSEVKDLTKKIHTVLQATAQMKEYDDIPEVLMDLQFSLAKSYSSTPELRETWLENMADTHAKQKNYSETAHCYIHAAALVAEYLKRQGIYPEGCAAFHRISPNVVPDESMMKTDESMAMEQRFTLKHLVEFLEKSAMFLERAERYEVMGEVYKLAIPIYEQERDFAGLASAYDNLSKAYRKVVDVMASGKRMLGKYFRVAFFGKVFGDDDGKEYIYKEPKVTSLPEISDRLQEMYTAKYRDNKIKLIHDSAKVHSDNLDSNFGHIQITYVNPYFDDDEKKSRPTPFEQSNNIRRFIYETPFTASGKAHGNLNEQCKRKTILTTSNTFPYVKKRILVVQEEQYELTPVEVAFDEMQNKVRELEQVTSQTPPDMKRLQLVLQGSVSVQVNAGPLAYAKTFLEMSVLHNYPAKHIERLQHVYKDFIKSCGKALDINHQLIKEDQQMYHDDMKDKYSQMRTELAKFIDVEHSSNMRKSGSSPMIKS
ncbi:dedicator of cytokinesis protein 11-like isoform X3 [Actinia tenebrosa]|uniref:Dedicator of cytokinesis protein 11-like isoform X3 n=1 Tax=Actinia tenebrosa TaxID=6105 RepID=A0A6P8IL21_ACTTE|nr:dedicator of cytokinesis protein 11-like isoform X3 [Actinia tenebrosa]